jgi:hypothetical protein
VRTGDAIGPRTFSKTFHSPAGHTHPMERTVVPISCGAPGLRSSTAYEVSDITAGAVPFEEQLDGCHSPTSWTGKPRNQKKKKPHRA